MIQDVMIPGKHCTCDVCGREWDSLLNQLPKWCPTRSCRSREWNGKTIQRRPQKKIALPRPKKVRPLYEHATDHSEFEF